MRGASKVTLQPHQILRLPRNLEAQDFSRNSLKWFDDNPSIIWRESDDNPSMKSSSRTRRFGDLTRPILETILYCKIQHFALRLSPKMSQSAAPVTKSHPPTSPNTAPATQNECHQWSASHMQRHLQCVEQVKSPSNLTKYCACHAKWMSSMICVTYETSFPMRGASKVTLQPHQILRLPRNLEAQDFSRNSLKWFDDNPSIIWRESDDNPSMKSSSRTRRFGDLTRPILEMILYCKIQHFALRLSPKMSQSAAPVTKSHPPTSPNTAPATQNELWTVTLLNCDCTELLLYWTVSVLNCDCTELWLYRTVTLLNCDCTELWLYWTVTLLNCYFTDLWLYWTVTLLNCYFTELLLDWSVTFLNCYFTELLLYWIFSIFKSS